MPLMSQWEKVKTIPALYNNNYWLDVFFLDSNPNYGWVCGYRGAVIRTTDGGLTWRGTSIPTVDQLESIHFVSPTVGYTSGLTRMAEGRIYKTTDGGASWRSVTDPRAGSLWGNFFMDENNGVTIGGGCYEQMQFFRTSDGGQTWNLFVTDVVNSGLTDAIIYNVNGLGYASSSGKIWKTNDGGYTWSIMSISGSEDWQEEINHSGNTFLLPFSGGCSAGGPGGIRYSRDIGISWNEYKTGYAMFGAFLLDSQKGWACGWAMSVYYTSDAGRTWELKNCGIEKPDSLDDVWFINDTTGFVVGSHVYRYVNIKELNPEITSDNSLTFCDGDSVTLFTKVPYKHYKWSTGDTTSSIIVKRSGTYYVTVNTNECDSATSLPINVKVNPNPTPAIETDKPPTICEGDSIYLRSNKVYINYLWSTGETSSSILVKQSGTYKLSVIDENGCTSSAEITINVAANPNPTITAIGNSEFCVGDSVKLVTEQGFTVYEWYDKDNKLVKTGSTSYTVTQSGSFYVKVKNQYGCEGISPVKEVTMLLDSNRLEINYFSADSIVFIDSTKFLSKKCKNVTITNRGDDLFVLDDIYIFRNIAFSIPQSQFPIAIPPKSSVEFVVCYSPTELGKQRDTLLLSDICYPHLILLESFGEPNYYSGDTRCEVPVKFVTKELNGDYVVTIYPPFPNPAGGVVHLPYFKYIPKDAEVEIKSYIINSLGINLFSGNENILKQFDQNNGYCISGEIIFETTDLVSGMYSIIIMINNELYTYPLVVVK